MAVTMASSAHPLFLLQRRPASPATAGPRADNQVRESPGARLACHLCLCAVTEGSQRISVGGAHAHRFVNPHGIEFEVGCFADASGCVTIGAASTYWSWFPGFAWQTELCGACGEHLGWLFLSPDALFHGLILDRLVEVAMD